MQQSANGTTNEIRGLPSPSKASLGAMTLITPRSKDNERSKVAKMDERFYVSRVLLVSLRCATSHCRSHCQSEPGNGTRPVHGSLRLLRRSGHYGCTDARYTGAETPEAVVNGLRKVLETPDDVPMEPFVAGTFWRCMDGKVWACFVGANLPCTEKADTSRTPTPDMADFCAANPTSDFIPAYVTGRATVYEWRCTAGAPEIVKQLVEPDAQGFQSNIWYEISPGDDS